MTRAEVLGLVVGQTELCTSDHAFTIGEMLHRLRCKRVKMLRSDWMEGRKCPRCNTPATAQKCVSDLVSDCPRSDLEAHACAAKNNGEDWWPYVWVQDYEAIDAAEAMEKLIERLTV